MSPMMLGFAHQRRQMIDAELQRFVAEMPQLGMTRLILVGSLVLASAPSPFTAEIELVVVQETEEFFHRRADFWVTHLRPSVGTSFYVYTEREFMELQNVDPLLLHAHHYGESLYG